MTNKPSAKISKEEVFAIYSEQFLTLDENRDFLRTKAENSAQRKEIREARQQAKINKDEAAAALFEDHMNEIKALVADFGNSQASIEESIADLKADKTAIDITNSVIKNGVKIGTGILNIVNG